MRLKSILIICLISIGYVSSQYQDNNYENNVNPYPRSQYDSGEVAYSPPTRSSQNNNYAAARPSSSSYARPKASIQPKAKLTADEEEAAKEAEEEKKPSELEILLSNSKFTCANLKNGYYADRSVECRVFHYCVDGAKHSWQCPAGTVFHQVHLNCVPAAQDICSQTEKYHFVNDYLHRPIEESLKPNQTVRYHQRYYPDEFLGDPAAPPTGSDNVVSYPASNPVNNRPAARQPAYNPASSYEDDDNISAAQPSPASYRSNSYSSNSARSNKPSYSSNYPSGYSTKPIIAAKPKPSYSGNYPVNLISSPQPSSRSRANYNDNYDSSSYGQPAARSYQSSSAKPIYKPNYSTSASNSNIYKPTSNAPVKPIYSGYQNAPTRSSSAGYESTNNANPHASGVLYEEDY